MKTKLYFIDFRSKIEFEVKLSEWLGQEFHWIQGCFPLLCHKTSLLTLNMKKL